MELNINCFAIIEFLTIPRILAYYSPNNNPDINEIREFFTNPTLSINVGHLLPFSYKSKSFFLLAGADSIVFFISTKSYYPQRLAYDCMRELEIIYNNKKINGLIDNKASQELLLNKNFLQVFKKLYEKYNNPESFDKLSQVKDKVNQVKDVMHNNINIALENTIKLESIELKSEELQQSAGIFKMSARNLKNKMWWKNFKMKLIIFSIIVIILTIIISVAVVLSREK